MKKEITDIEKKKLAQCDWCVEQDSSYHCLTLCKRVKDILDYFLDIIKKSGFNFNNVTPSTIFFNSFGSPNSFPFLIVLNVKKTFIGVSVIIIH